MISIIICSRNKVLKAELADNIRETVGIEFEIISIDNSKNSYNIYSAYNKGIELSRYDFLCFVHDDVRFNTIGWGEKILAHLKKTETGIVGLAGGNLACRIPSGWSAYDPSVNITHTNTGNNEIIEQLRLPVGFKGTLRPTAIMDGVFLSMKKSFFDCCKFDEEIGGFHGYDLDISIQSNLNGFQNYTAYDIEMEHFSLGKFDGNYFRNINRIIRKWESHLPLFEKNIPANQRALILKNVESYQLKRLIKRLARTGMNTVEIKENLVFYNRIIHREVNSFLLKFTGIRVFMIRLSSKLRNKKMYRT